MTLVSTNLANTRESARQVRYEPTGSISATNVQKAIEQAASQPPAVAATSVTFAMSPYTVLSTDNWLYVNTSGGAVTINMQAAVARAGVPLLIKDISGNGLANPISVVPSGAETIDSLSPYPLTGDFVGAQFNPRAGVGYTVSP